jgi:DNA-binding IscR family transcriptional regulator
MDNLEILRKLFDEKIILILNIFLDSPQESFSLTQISASSGVNNATTIRILNKLIDQNIVDLIRAGKSKVYKLKQSQKTLFLNMLIKKEYEISEIIEAVTDISGIEKIVLESRTKHGAKFIFITSTEQKDKIDAIAKKMNEKYDYKMEFIELREEQFAEMEKFGFQMSQKIVWEKNKATKTD